MGKLNSVSAYICAEVTTPDLSQLLRHLNNAGVELFDVVYTSVLTVEITFRSRQFKKVKRVLKKDDHIKIKKMWGMAWAFGDLVARSVFLLCFIFILSLTVYMPGRVFFFNVEGNITLPSNLILEKAADCGMRFGAIRRTVRSEKMKNALLSAIPELEWAGINTKGCVATISVKEKESLYENDSAPNNVSSIIALRDGVVLSCSVSKGNLLCKPGQAVKAGQTLVSAYSDCGIKILATQAEGEIIAQTYRSLRMVTPINSDIREVCTGQETKYSLLVGKKLINFYKDSGICDTTCAKIYKQNYITLPGGFSLPVALITETWQYYETEAVTCEAEEFSWTSYAADTYLLKQMVAGKIQSKETSFQLVDDVCLFEGRYICVEMIGQVKNEETVYNHGEYYGENR